MNAAGHDDRPAIAGGKPVRNSLLPYGFHDVGEEEENAVLEVLRHGWLTTGPRVREFEAAFAAHVGAKHAVAMATGTAALQLTMLGLGVGKGDEVITSPLTFVATANGIVHAGGTPVFADIDPDTLNIDPEEVKKRVSRKTKVLLPVHLTGAPCDMRSLRKIARNHGISVAEDACHAVGASIGGKAIGSEANAQCFSFHPVKNMTTAEGAVVTTPHKKLADVLRALRFHGFREDYLSRSQRGSLGYPRMHVLGFKSVLTDIQAALGLVQLRRVEAFTARRDALARVYSEVFGRIPELQIPVVLPGTTSAWHIYVLRLRLNQLRCSRDEFMEALKRENIGTSVHYLPVHLQPYYQKNFGFRKGDFPVAEAEYRKMITLPLFSKMTDSDQSDVIRAVTRLVAYFRK